jgi:hypothetical protein
MPTLTTTSQTKFIGFNENKYIDQDLVQINYDGGDGMVIAGYCNANPIKYGYDEKIDIYGNMEEPEYTGFKQIITLSIMFMDNEQYKLLQEHWLKGTATKIKSEDDEVYHNLVLLGNSLNLNKDYDVDGIKYWKGSLTFRQK